MANGSEEIGTVGAGDPICLVFSLFSPVHHGSSAQNSTNYSILQPENSRTLILKPYISLLPSQAEATHGQAPEDAAGTQCLRAVPHRTGLPQCQPSRSLVGDTEGLGTGRYCLLQGTLNQQKSQHISCFGCAWVFLNGLQKGKSKNIHRPWRQDQSRQSRGDAEGLLSPQAPSTGTP